MPVLRRDYNYLTVLTGRMEIQFQIAAVTRRSCYVCMIVDPSVMITSPYLQVVKPIAPSMRALKV